MVAGRSGWSLAKLEDFVMETEVVRGEGLHDRFRAAFRKKNGGSLDAALAEHGEALEDGWLEDVLDRLCCGDDDFAQPDEVEAQPSRASTTEALFVREWLKDRLVYLQEPALGNHKVSLDFTPHNQVRLSGRADQVALVRVQLLTRLQELKETFAHQICKVDTHLVKHFIGKEGKRIKELRTKTKARIEVASVESEAGKTDIIVDGTIQAVTDAVHDIMRWQEDNQTPVTLEIPVEKKYFGTLIGKDGCQIKLLRAEHPKVFFDFSAKESEEEAVVLRGPTREVRRARQSFQEALDDVMDEEWLKDGQVLPISPTHFRLIQGPKYARVDEIRRKTHVKMVFNWADGLVTFSGRGGSIREAVAEVLALDQGVVSEKMAVPHFLHGLLIGKGGRNLEALETELGVVASFPPKASQSNEVVLCALGREELGLGLDFVMRSAAQLEESHYEDEVEVPAHLRGHIIGKRGVGLKELLDGQPEVHMGLPKEGDPSPKVRLSGPKNKVGLVRNLLHLRCRKMKLLRGAEPPKPQVEEKKSSSGCVIS